MSESLVLIDLSGIAHPIYHTNDGDANPNATSTAVVERIRALSSAHKHVAICCDSGRSFRYDIDPSYKGNRRDPDKQDERARILHQIGLAVETLRGDGFPIWAAKGFEADDIIASAAREIHYRQAASNVDPDAVVLIISPDKDLRQLVSDHVEVLAPGIADRPAKTYDSEAVFLRHGVQPHQLLDYFALVGDASDNIKGADGIGEKKAAAMLAKFGNLDDVMAALESPETSSMTFTPSTRKSLTEFRPRMDTVRSLIRLRTDAPIEFEQIFRERVPLDVAVFSEGDDVDDIDYAMQTLEEHEHKTNDSDATESPEIEPGRTQALPLGSDNSHQGSESGNLKTLPPVQQGMERAGAKDLQTARQPIVVQPAPAEWERQLEPRNMIEAIKLATILFQSKLFSQWGTEAECLATILAGRELGVQSLASLRGFHKIDGKPTMSASLMRGLVLQSRKQEYFQCIERTNDRATFKTLRKGNPQPTELTYTVDDARKAWTKSEASWNGSGWVKNPADMCAARASSKLARLEYDDVLFGLYATEEFDQ